VGALLVWLFAYLQYAGFNVFNTVLAGEAVAGSLHIGDQTLWFWVVTIIAAVVALFGYDLIHGFERYLTYSRASAQSTAGCAVTSIQTVTASSTTAQKPRNPMMMSKSSPERTRPGATGCRFLPCGSAPSVT
jgi:purine-cytosine permease-like protein